MRARSGGLVDAHLHLQMPALREFASRIIEETRNAGVEQLLVNATSPQDWKDVADLAELHSDVTPFFGIHPWQVNSMDHSGWEDQLRNFLTRFPESGVGEVGLDKWIRDHDIAKQRDFFLRQLTIAESLGRPVAVHCLRAWGHLWECLAQSEFSQPFLLHSFSGPKEMIGDFVDRGAFFSLSGYFFRPEKSAKLEAFQNIPDDRLLLETDAPDMLPPANLIATTLPPKENGSPVNHPANLRRIYEVYSEWSGRDLDEVISSLSDNAANFLRKRSQ